MSGFVNFLNRFRREEGASATIEFALLVPLMLMFCLSTIELGILLTRQVMLDRAVDIAVRAVRLNHLVPVEHDSLVALICENSLIIPDCNNQLKLEMILANPRAWPTIRPNADCIDREEDAQPPANFTPGVENQLVILRACSLFDPVFPTTGLGAQLNWASGGAYSLVTINSYVVEPQ